MMTLREDKIIDHTFTNLLHTVLLLGGMILLISLLGYLFAGTSGILWASILGFILFIFSPRLSPQLILRAYRARELHPYEAEDLYYLLQELSHRAGLARMPRLYYVPSRIMNAFALGNRDRSAIGVTDGLLRGLNARELSGVLAHELSHIRNNDMRVMGIADLISRLTSIFSTFGQILLFLNLPLLLVGGVTVNWLAILLLIAAPTLSALLQLALSRTREFDADLGAARLTGDPQGLASALQKLEFYQGGFLKQIFLPGHRVPGPSMLRTHPPTAERVRRLRSLSGIESEPTFRDISGPFGFIEQLQGVRRSPRWHVMGIWY